MRTEIRKTSHFKISTSAKEVINSHKHDIEYKHTHSQTYKHTDKLFPCKAKGSVDGKVLVKSKWSKCMFNVMTESVISR